VLLELEDVEYPPLRAYWRWWYVQCGLVFGDGNSVGYGA
jgi:hypothetical protein